MGEESPRFKNNVFYELIPASGPKMKTGIESKGRVLVLKPSSKTAVLS